MLHRADLPTSVAAVIIRAFCEAYSRSNRRGLVHLYTRPTFFFEALIILFQEYYRIKTMGSTTRGFYKEVTDELTDAQAMSYNNPTTFWAPDSSEINSIKEGDNVKICHEEAKERFWVKVAKAEEGLIWGTVANDLVCLDWSFGKKIMFSAHCVYNVYRP